MELNSARLKGILSDTFNSDYEVKRVSDLADLVEAINQKEEDKFMTSLAAISQTAQTVYLNTRIARDTINYDKEHKGCKNLVVAGIIIGFVFVLRAPWFLSIAYKIMYPSKDDKIDNLYLEVADLCKVSPDSSISKNIK